MVNQRNRAAIEKSCFFGAINSEEIGAVRLPPFEFIVRDASNVFIITDNGESNASGKMTL